MISRLPKTRASTEKAPGPSPAMATSMVIVKTKELRESKKSGEQAGSNENPTAVVPAARTAAAIGVRKPARSKAPPASARHPLSQEARAESACVK